MRKISIDGAYGSIVGIIKEKNKDLITILVHGFGATKNNKSIIQAELFFENLGISTIRFDLYNHGESIGAFEDMTVNKCVSSLDSVISWLLNNDYKSIGILGSSMGGLVSMVSASKTPNKLKFLILKSPVSRNQGKIIANHYRINLSKWKKKDFYEWINKLGVKTKLNYEFYEDARKYDATTLNPLKSISSLIVHGRNDKFVDLKYSIALNSNLHKSQLKIIDDANHFYSKKNMDELLTYSNIFLKSLL